ncbi:zinc finger CCCH domain-containing protein 19 isoform X2 [Rosa rugosa]|uniref:zinc finger CCCH domain-containing protein 19 isoform X2 n=1 Tax=Rosa rugosa TaxID=74645 RepID=UPI002B40DD4D|nr:zinc finger CCCH domain-containing protein 19 isoform X2 [Rosa rugosa]
MAAEAEREEVEAVEVVEGQREEVGDGGDEVGGVAEEVQVDREEEVKLEGEGVELEKAEVELEREEIREEEEKKAEEQGHVTDMVDEIIETEARAEAEAVEGGHVSDLNLKDRVDQTLETSDGAEVEDTFETTDAVEEGKGNEAEVNATDMGDETNGTEAVEEGKEGVVTDMVDETIESEAMEEGKRGAAEGHEANVTVTESDEIFETTEAVEEGKVSEAEGDEANVKDMVHESIETEAAGEEGQKAEVEGHEADAAIEAEEAVEVAQEVEADGDEQNLNVKDMVDDAIETQVSGGEEHEANTTIEAEEVGQDAEAEGGERNLNVKDMVDDTIETQVSGDVRQEAEAEGGEQNLNVKDMVDDTIQTQVSGEEEQEAEVEGHELTATVTNMVDEADEAVVTTEAVAADVSDDVMEETEAAEGAEEMEADEMEAAEEEEAEEMEMVEDTNTSGVGGKRKRRKNSKAAASEKVLSKKKEEDVCFICFDGGELVLCDRRGCPKAYHPSCVNRDEAFFRAKGRWNCGWHLCSNCEKNAHYMCYTCTFSLCKACTKDAVILCIKGNKGFCETCMKTVMLIEKNEHGNKEKDAVDFDDKSSWEYLFKDYWTDLKERLSLTLDDLSQAKNPWKGSAGHANKHGSHDEPYDANIDGGSDSDNSENLDSTNSKRRKGKKRLKTRAKGKNSSSPATGSGGRYADDNTEWASKELLEFVMHMRNGDSSALSQFDVQALLLEYIKRNKLRDPRRKSQIICDLRLQSLFGKPRVGHFEMLKLLESHFFMKEDSQVDDHQGSVVDTEGNQLEADGHSDTPAKASKDKKRKRKKNEPQSNVEDFAAIDIHNINLIYLRRNLVEDLLEDTDNFQEKVAGSFVRIRISGSGQKQDLYRLVQVIGTCKAAEPYKVGKRMTDILLEILNLNKTEIVTIDIISNQEFTEDECKRLRQSIKCGLINRLTVGDVQEKAVVLQPVRVKDWLETETVRLQHLRDRASEKGRRKELRECVEKLQLLKTPEERQRRLEETLEIHADPNMDPSYESEEDEDEGESYTRPTGSGFGRKGREPISPRRGGSSLNDSWSGTRNFSNMNRDFGRSMSGKGIFNKAENTTGAGEIVNDTWGQGRETPQTNYWENKQNISSLETGSRSTQSVVPSEASPAGAPENRAAPISTGVAQSVANINETEKIWHYQDPSGKVQGPFSMIQLRKWNNTGYFPPNLRVWKNTDKQEDSILVTDALVGKFQKDPSIAKAQMVHDSHLTPASSGKAQGAQLQQSLESQSGGGSWGAHNEIISSTGRGTPSSVEVPKYTSDGWGTTNFPSPTPSQTPISGAKRQAYENNWPPSPGGNGVMQSHAVLTPETAMRVSGNDPSTSLPGMTAAPNALQMHGQVTVSGPVLANASVKPLPDVQNIVSNLQNLVQSVTNRTTASDTRAWGSGTVPGSESQPWGGAPSQKIEPNNATNVPAQHPSHGYWPPTNNGTSSINTGNSAGNFPAQGFSGVPNSDAWRPPVPSNQSYIQPPAQPQVPWGSSVSDNQSTVPRMGQESQNSGWVPVAGNPNVAWGGPVPGNSNMNWAAPSQSPGWSASGQVPVRGNAVPSWAPPPGQGPPSVSANPGWAPPGQGPALGNANSGWSAPTANQTQNGDRFSNQRDRGSHGGDSGFGGGKPWNRQPSFGGGGGGGSSRPPFKGRVCRYFESGHCKKGSSCDYLHPDH